MTFLEILSETLYSLLHGLAWGNCTFLWWFVVPGPKLSGSESVPMSTFIYTTHCQVCGISHIHLKIWSLHQRFTLVLTSQWCLFVFFTEWKYCTDKEISQLVKYLCVLDMTETSLTFKRFGKRLWYCSWQFIHIGDGNDETSFSRHYKWTSGIESAFMVWACLSLWFWKPDHEVDYTAVYKLYSSMFYKSGGLVR